MLEILSIFQLSHLLQVYFHGNKIAMSREAIQQALQLIEHGKWERFEAGCKAYQDEAVLERIRIMKMNARAFAKLFSLDPKAQSSILRDPRPYKLHYIQNTVDRKVQIANNMRALIHSLPEVEVHQLEPDQDPNELIKKLQQPNELKLVKDE